MSKRIDDIEILRGFSVLLIVMHHARGNLFTWSSPGLERFGVYFSGTFCVDLFFAISGYLIARDLIPRLQASSGSKMVFRTILAFWIRRAWRILPSAWLWLGLILLAVVLCNESGAFGSFRTNMEATMAGVLQLANLRFAEVFGHGPYGVSFVYWTLSLEEQFYLVFPLVVILAKRYLPHALIALVVFQLLSERSIMMVVFRTDAIALGILLAIWSRHATYEIAKPEILLKSQWLGTLVMASLFFCMGVVGSTVLHVISYKFSVFALLSALLLWIASYNLNLFIPVQPFRSLMLWVGSRSYAIYLIHIPAFYLSREIWFRLQPGVAPGDELFFPLLLTTCALLVPLSELNYRLIETPLRSRGARIATRFLAAGSSIPAPGEPAPQLIKG